MPDLRPLCLHWPIGQRRPCYRLATHMLRRPSGQQLDGRCADHLAPEVNDIRGPYVAQPIEEWAASGSGYRGRQLGGESTAAT